MIQRIQTMNVTYSQLILRINTYYPQDISTYPHTYSIFSIRTYIPYNIYTQVYSLIHSKLCINLEKSTPIH